MHLEMAQGEHALRLEQATVREAAAVEDLAVRAKNAEAKVRSAELERDRVLADCAEADEAHVERLEQLRAALAKKHDAWQAMAQETEAEAGLKVLEVRALADALKDELRVEVLQSEAQIAAEVKATRALVEDHRSLVEDSLSRQRAHVEAARRLAEGRILEAEQQVKCQLAVVAERTQAAVAQANLDLETTRAMAEGRVRRGHLMAYLDHGERHASGDEAEAEAGGYLDLELWVKLPGASAEAEIAGN